jgi:hypothetical protein
LFLFIALLLGVINKREYTKEEFGYGAEWQENGVDIGVSRSIFNYQISPIASIARY